MYRGFVLQDVSLWPQVSSNCACPAPCRSGDSGGQSLRSRSALLDFYNQAPMKPKKKTATVARSVLLKFRCTEGEKKIIRRQAAASGKNLSEYCRGQALHGKIYAARRLTPEERQYFIRTSALRGSATSSETATRHCIGLSKNFSLKPKPYTTVFSNLKT